MAFVSVNEIDKFGYSDCICVEMINKDNVISLVLESLIVRANNSQNSNYTDSYADVTDVVIEGGDILKVVKVGYSRYDADDNLIEKIPDEECSLDKEDWAKKFTKTFLVDMRQVSEDEISMMFEMPDEDPSAITEMYEVFASAKKISFSWERYMNRVQY